MILMSLKNLARCYNAIVSSLDDPETPVRVHAALALSEMIRHNYGKNTFLLVLALLIQSV